MVRKDNLTMLRALYLRATYDMPEADVAALLSVGQSAISRWWTAGLRNGLVREQRRLTFDETGVPLERLEQIRHVDSWVKRLERLRGVSPGNGVRVRALRVFRSAEGRGTSPIDVRLKRFSHQAGGILCDTVRRATICAVASGYTISNAVDAMATAYGGVIPEQQRNPRPHGVRFVPVWPEDITDPSPRISSSALAERLDDIFNSHPSSPDASRRPPRPPSLNGVPPFTPHYFSTPKFRRYLEEDFPGYREVFGCRSGPAGPQPLVAGIDMLLTSIGARDRPFGRFHELLIKHAGVAAGELTAIVAGDVGGVLIPAPRCTDAQRRRVRQINSIWNGLQPEHLEDIAVRAQQPAGSPPPGVVIVSIESSDGGRAKALAAAIRAGLVNELVIDEQLAEGLDRELQADPEADAPRPRGSRKTSPADAARAGLKRRGSPPL